MVAYHDSKIILTLSRLLRQSSRKSNMDRLPFKDLDDFLMHAMETGQVGKV